MPLFSFDEIAKPTTKDPEDKSAVLRDSFLNLHERKIVTLKHLVGKLPAQNEFIALWTLKSFNAFTFIPFLIKELGVIETLIISTYTINRRIIDSLIKKIDQGKIKQVHLFIADSLKFRMPKAVDHLASLADARNNIFVTYAWNHSKITLVQTGDHYFVIEGSGNWSENAQHEQYMFFNHEKLYKFFLNCITNDLHPGANGNN